MRPSIDIIANAVSAGATFNGTVIVPTNSVFSVSVQIVAASSAGTPTGVFKLQFSNDQPLNGNPTSWSDITNATVNIADDGTYAINKIDICANFVRCVYTRTSGTGTITAVMKSLGM